jgi:aryl-alcohol dehydrogenase-like predicted oxidoreductase
MLRPGLDTSQAPPGLAPTQEQERTLDDIAARHGATRPQVALAWLLTRSPITLAIPGTSSVAHLEENLAAADLPLTQDDIAQLDKLA